MKESMNGDSGNGFGMDDLAADAAAAVQFGLAPAERLVDSRQSSTTTGSAFNNGHMPREPPGGHLMRESVRFQPILDGFSALMDFWQSSATTTIGYPLALTPNTNPD